MVYSYILIILPIHIAICGIVLAVMLVIQLYYIWFVYGQLARYKVKPYKDQPHLPPVSVVICAHNEEENLQRFLPVILSQNYPDYEVIVVNDCSTDDTRWILQDLCLTHPQLKVIDIKEHIQLKHSKKFALTLGIKAAKNDILLMTDADCLPQSLYWIAEMAATFTDGTEIVLGYSPYDRLPGFLNRVIRFETTHTAMSYLSYALKGNAYMGVGRNLAYTKTLFFKGKGFNAHMHIKSGDDDLFVNANAHKGNVAIAIHPDSHVYSVPKTSWPSYYKQKARHAGASVLYKNTHKIMLATQLISACLFYLSLILFIILAPMYAYYALAAYLLRLLSQFIVFRAIYRKLHVKDLLPWLPILDLFYYFYICFNGLLNRRRKQQTWK